ncbi:MAG TPA: glucoamylase family protein [Phycisphaerae bacterium]|nr:glucoamylase family protein [Phycisphaerae bacterium]
MAADREESPLRSELFSIDQLRVHAREIAGWHKLAATPASDRLLTRLTENERVLLDAYREVTAAVREERRPTPAGEWLIDNFYLIEEQIQTAQRHLPKRYSLELPQLSNGPAAGQPRVYHIALELVAHLDGGVNVESTASFVAAYQATTVLRLGELWAVPIMLRLALIENLRRIAARIASGRRDRNLADTWASRLIDAAEKQPASLIVVVADMARSEPPLSSAFVTELFQQLQGKNPALALPLTWIEQRLSEQALSVEGCIQLAAQSQTSDQVSMGNSIGSLRALGAIDWRDFVEELSVVEHALRRDPANVYAMMDFATRDRYRHVIEAVAHRSRRSEEDVARESIGLAGQSSVVHGTTHRKAHVGYYLIDKGLPQLVAAVESRVPMWERAGRLLKRMPLTVYLLLILMIALSGSGMLLIRAAHDGAHGWLLGLVGLVTLICMSQLGVAVANWLITQVVIPRMLPRMDFAKGISADSATLVVVPTMLNSEQGVDDLLENLEIRYLANRDDHLRFALLTDFQDAAQETLPEDAALLRRAVEGIEALNIKYRPAHSNDQDAFYLFHRPRRWNPREGFWMGYERKRGKLAQLNAVLRGSAPDDFAVVVGKIGNLQSIRYVITLDTDTELPRDAARQLIATMAHPLMRPDLDPATGRIRDGYSILQPRVAVSLPSSNRSWFVRLLAGEPGIDPYTRTTSDVYQDLFQEGSFVGKGIYDVDAFEKNLRDRFPENQILSHDLLEGCYARAGLVSDVQLYEDYPWHFNADARRRHRWVRGDWQIFSWLLPRVPGFDGKYVRNPLSALSRWKLFDNLRRSLVAPAMLLLLLVGWIALAAPFWTLTVLAIITAPALLAAIGDVFRKTSDLPVLLHLRAMGAPLFRSLAHVLSTIVFLPFDALVNIDAIARTLFRMLITRRHLLEWVTASDSQRSARTDLESFVSSMLATPLLALATFVILAIWRPASLGSAAPLLVAWMGTPAMAWLLSRPRTRRDAVLTDQQQTLLRRTARRTWHYFETFFSPDDHYLPPDNYQEQPVAVIAHRTSPTNIGIAMLSGLAAYDFGYLSVGQLIDRTDKTLASLEKLERHHGHFYNWYDTRSLRPLHPLYVSTVDSGNLVGHLLTLRQGFLELADRPVLGPRAFQGIGDTLHVVLHAIRQQNTASRQEISERIPQTISTRVEQMLDALELPPAALTASYLLLQRLTRDSAQLLGALPSGVGEEIRWPVEALAAQCQGLLDDLVSCAQWIVLPPPDENHSHGDADRTHLVAEFQAALRSLEGIPTLREVAAINRTLLPSIVRILADTSADGASRIAEFHDAFVTSVDRASHRIARLEALADHCQSLSEMDFRFLLDESRELLSIGFKVTERRCDPSFYDLLASEARLGTFIAIARGDLPQESWFRLGRRLTSTAAGRALLSWSGSMFEYLMPLLVMPTYDGTLLDATYDAVVARHIEYGRERGVPWGISECCYNLTDAHFNYQYRAFGVPGLGFMRGLADDLVIAPYATILALMVAPESAVRNLERLAADGFLGKYGYYEAVDYTPARLASGRTHTVIRSYMVHHEGMSLLALAYLMLGRPMQRRFLADPLLKATELLLHERIPKVAPVYPHVASIETSRSRDVGAEALMRFYKTPHTPAPEVHLLSNGQYHVMISNAGSGYSRWRDMAVTRWREDPTRDCWGTYCYVRDRQNRRFWSATYQPTLKTPTNYEVLFQQARAEFRRSDGDIDTFTEICVSPEDDIELRRVTLTNRSRTRRTVEITSYAEVVIAAAAADNAHPAFSNLFVQTQIVRNRGAILCTRRPRSEAEKPPWMVHLMAIQGTTTGSASYETDRSRFVGRGRTIESPAALDAPDLSDSEGAVLDPIVAIRQTLVLEPHQSAKVVIATGIGETREAATALLEKYHDPRLADRAFEMATTHSQVLLRQLNATEADAQVFGHLVGSIVHASRTRRADPLLLTRNRRGQSALWAYSISGDLPIVLLRIGDAMKIELVRQMVQAHAYWRMKGLAVDLVIWNEDTSGYRQAMHDQIMGVIAGSTEAHTLDRPGGIFVRRTEQMSDEDRTLLQTVARAIITDTAGTLADQVDRRATPAPGMPRLATINRRYPQPPNPPEPPRQLAFFNGFGGFTPDGKEYVITTDADRTTPAPWVNVLANAQFGTVISESGSAYTWAENAHEYRLTPWSNDPISDVSGEAFYIRDDESGTFWSPTPLPARGAGAYTSRHGMGYSVFEHVQDGIRTELTVFVATDAPVKFLVLKLSNNSGRSRRLSVTGYCEWVLGDLRHKSLMYIVTELDPRTGAIFARNSYNSDFADRISFMDVNEPTRSVTSDRTEFLGRNGTLGRPAAMTRARLSGRTGAGLDPCAAIQVPFELAEGQQHEVVFILGSAGNGDDARNLIQRFRSSQGARQALEGVWNYWSRTLGTVYVETPDPGVNILANGWLVYQTLACRMWARSGFYQSGGAFGFRDQLQDAMALVHAEPRLLREHLLRAAAHQFRDGDVQHWWHPPIGRGVRTHFSDDYLWLPLATCRYVASIGDTGVLDERIAYLEGRAVRPEEESYYDLPGRSETTGTLYEHCVRAIENGLKVGSHGLPLIGCGDWNDGMNLIGEHGRGESVWLAFFLHDVLSQFAELARRHGDNAFADRCVSHAAKLQDNIERHAWDGHWYRRAYFDNGEPLGSAANPECQIDSLPQSWSVLAAIGDRQRRVEAMNAVDARLVRRDSGIIQLFDPPFDKSSLNPGYIKGYLPGVRENGGQYTHAAIWTTMAFALLGDHQRAWDLFNMINPINRARSADTIATYKVEPYVVAADVYAVVPHVGRGGWTWYTGSAGWMYRLVVETLLGLTLKQDRLLLTPRLPAAWDGFKMHYRYRETFYHLTISKAGDGIARVIVDGNEQPDRAIPLIDDRSDHHAQVYLATIP